MCNVTVRDHCLNAETRLLHLITLSIDEDRLQLIVHSYRFPDNCRLLEQTNALSAIWKNHNNLVNRLMVVEYVTGSSMSL